MTSCSLCLSKTKHCNRLDQWQLATMHEDYRSLKPSACRWDKYSNARTWIWAYSSDEDQLRQIITNSPFMLDCQLVFMEQSLLDRCFWNCYSSGRHFRVMRSPFQRLFAGEPTYHFPQTAYWTLLQRRGDDVEGEVQWNRLQFSNRGKTRSCQRVWELNSVDNSSQRCWFRLLRLNLSEN